MTLLFHAEVTPDDGTAAQLQQQPSPNGGGNGALSYEHQSLAGAEAILAAGGTVDRGAGSRRRRLGRDARSPRSRRSTRELENIGRNDPCWCGSGKKFKKCHGA